MEISTLRRRKIHRRPAKLRNGLQLLRRKKYEGGMKCKKYSTFLESKNIRSQFLTTLQITILERSVFTRTLVKNIDMRDLGERKTKRDYSGHVQYEQIDPKHYSNPGLLERSNGLRHSSQTTPSLASCATTMDHRRPMKKNLSDFDQRTS